MNPDKANTTGRETTEAESMQSGDKTRKQDGIEQNDANRGSGQGKNQQGDNRSEQNKSDRNDQNDEGNKGTNGLNR